MRAAVIHQYGPPEVLSVEQVPDPVPGPGQILVDVHAASVNPVDYKLRQGNYRVFLRYRMPRILGLDLSGVVAAVGEGVTKFAVGDAVFGSPDYHPPGCYAERCVVHEDQLWAKPPRLSHHEAASLPLVFETSWQSLVDLGGLAPEQHCFVQAGSGGIGTVAIQIAKYRGARVTTTCSERNVEFVTSLGADRVVDYRREAFDEVVRDVDVCLETLGVPAMHRARAIMRRGGRLIGITSNIPERVRRWGPLFGFLAVGSSVAWVRLRNALAGVRTQMHTQIADGACLRHCHEMLEAGALTPCIERVFPLDDIVEAHRQIETGRTRGKIVLDMGR